MNGTAWDELSAAAPHLVPFFQHGAEGRLVIPQCKDCELHTWPPRELCRRCHGEQSQWVEVTPRGLLYSWTSNPASDVKGERSVIGVITLDLPDLVRFVGRVHLGPTVGDPIGLPVAGEFEREGGGLPLLVWHAVQAD